MANRNDTFIQKLINDSLNFQNLFKAEEAKNKELKYSFNNLNTTIDNLKSTIEAKETEIESLKQNNIKYLIKIGSYTLRNQLLENNINKLESELNELFLKYEESNNNYHSLTEKYTELEQKNVKADELNVNNLREFIRVIQIYNDENAELKQQLALEKQNFIELQKILQATYEELIDAKENF